MGRADYTSEINGPQVLKQTCSDYVKKKKIELTQALYSLKD